MLPRFEYYAPRDLGEACALKAAGAKPVAGGTDVYVNMHGGKERAGKIVDLKGVEALRELRLTEEGLYLGALTTHRQVELWEELRGRFYALYQGCSQVGSVQIRCRGTLGGNVMNGAPSADSAGPLLVHGAEAVVAGPAGERRVPLEKFSTGLKTFDLGEEELLKGLFLPLPPDNAGSAYFKYTRRNAMDLALVGVSAYAEVREGVLEHVRVALTTAGPTPLRSYAAEAALEGQPVSDALIVRAAEAAAAEGRPRSSWRSSAEFRTRLIHDLTIQVLHEAVLRAGLPPERKAEPIPQRLYWGQIGKGGEDRGEG